MVQSDRLPTPVGGVEAVVHAGLKAQDVDDVIMGCVTQVGEQGMNIARGAVLAAGLPIELPGTTVNRFCGSGLQAVNFGAQAVLSGASQLVVAGGVEHMTRVPMGSDALGGEGPASPGLQQHWPSLVPQGLSAEMIAAKWGYSREKLDEFAVQSQRKAASAIEKHVKQVFMKLDLPPSDNDHRRILAVLRFLGG